MKSDPSELITTLTKSIEKVSQAKDNKEICEKIETLLIKFTASDFASLFMFDDKQQTLYTKKKNDIPLSMVVEEGCLGKVFLTKTSAIYNHLASDKDYISKYDNPFNYKLKSQMLMPIVENNQLVGIVRVSRAINGNPKYYTKDDLEILTSISSYLIKIVRTLNSNSNLTKESNNSTDKIEESIKKVHKKGVDITDKDMLLFLSNTVHDIRTPANSLHGFLELLEEQIQDERLKEFIVNAKESASFINTLTDSILAKTKNRYEGSISKPMIINTVKFLADATNIFAAKMSEKKLNYFIFICPELPKEIRVDTLKLKRVLINLIGNAYKFTPKENRIDVLISYDKKSKKMTISVKDTGIGIAKEDQNKLFKAFSQAREDTSMEYGGTGLGLSISAEYVADLGGTLNLKSSENEGSDFYFDISLDIVNGMLSYEKFYNLKKKIVILTDDLVCKNAAYIRSYLVKLGMPEDKIYISNIVEKGTTHLICFEHKITREVLAFGKTSDVELLLIEEKLFSLLNNKETNMFKIISENTYYGDAIYSLVFSGKKVKVLIVDDNKINVSLLKSMLAIEYVEVDSCMDGESALKILKNDTNFDILYLDKHMPGISGTELLETFRNYEKENKRNPIFAVSISGDPDVSKEEKKLFNAFVNKPFNKQEVREVIALVKN